MGGLYGKIRRKFHRIRYGESYPDPYKVIWVDPQNIDSVKSVENVYRGFIKRGDWDRKTGSITSSKFKALKKRFEEDLDWEETDIYTSLRDLLERKGNVDGCHSLEGLKDKYENYVEELYREIQENGYRTQVELGNTPESKPGKGEVYVSIGRDGELIHGNRGWHRFSIARILDLEKMPVQVILRHRKWQDLREEIVNTEDFDELSEKAKENIDHPDLKDIVPESWMRRSDA